VGVNIDTDDNDDGQINVAELSATGDKIQVTLLLPTGAGTAAAVGDTVTIKRSSRTCTFARVYPPSSFYARMTQRLRRD
jgi:hypothetical protein